MDGGGGGGGEVASAAAGPPAPLDWKFSQVFGERTAGEEVQEGKWSISGCERILFALGLDLSFRVWVSVDLICFWIVNGLIWKKIMGLDWEFKCVICMSVSYLAY